MTKKTDPGYIDHVCGVVASGENPTATAFRESLEETTVVPLNLQKVSEGINGYRRWCTLFIGETDKVTSDIDPQRLNPREVEWAKFISPQDLLMLEASRQYPFVGDFFENMTEARLSALTYLGS